GLSRLQQTCASGHRQHQLTYQGLSALDACALALGASKQKEPPARCREFQLFADDCGSVA
ncbi:MAG: hypothetical protein ACRDKI_08250, partial [Solirubrobacterales bacterium]